MIITDQIQQILRTKGGLPSANVALVEHLGALAKEINTILGEKALPSSKIAVTIKTTDPEENLSSIMLMVGATLVNTCTIGDTKVFLYQYAS